MGLGAEPAQLKRLFSGCTRIAEPRGVFLLSRLFPVERGRFAVRRRAADPA
jgi:hypothetical protein